MDLLWLKLCTLLASFFMSSDLLYSLSVHLVSLKCSFLSGAIFFLEWPLSSSGKCSGCET